MGFSLSRLIASLPSLILALGFFAPLPQLIWAESAQEVSHGRLMTRLRQLPASREPDFTRLPAQVRGQPFYARVEDLRPGQYRYSIENVNKHISEIRTELGLTRNQMVSVDTPLMPLSEAQPVILTPQGMILLDGHHHAMASIYLGSTEFPVVVVEDLRHLSEQERRRAIERLQLTSYRGREGRVHRISRFSQMQPDSLLMMVRQVRARIKVSKAGPIRGSGADYPVWVAFKGDPYSELKIADALYQAGYRVPRNYNGHLTPAMIQDIRARLLRIQRTQPELLAGISLIETNVHRRSINFTRIYREHQNRVKAHPCLRYFAQAIQK